MPTYPVEALILRGRDLGEADRALTLYTREKGKIAAVARGVRKPGAKLASLVQALSCNKLYLAVGRTYDIVTQVQPIKAFVRLRQDLDRLSLALFWAELLDHMLHEGEAHEDIYELALQVLALIDRAPNPEAALRWGEFQLLSALGYEPVVNQCAQCGRVPSGMWAGYSPASGGILCARCGVAARDSVRIPLAAVEEIKQFVRSETPPEEPAHLEPIGRAMRAQWRNLLDSELKSATFLDNLRLEPGA